VVFTFMWTWNQLFLPMVMITQTDLRPLPVGLTYFQGQYGTNIPVVAAAAIIASLPVVVLYWLFQRQFVQGLTLGAVKG
jgi:raffinose/stachyose/melibiose transport system permease protein